MNTRVINTWKMQAVCFFTCRSM